MQKEDWGYFLFQLSPLKPRTILKIISKVGSSEKAFKLEEEILSTYLNKKQLIKFLKFRKDYKNLAKSVLNTVNKLNLEIITINSKKYPSLLKSIYDPPLCLFIEGSLSEPDQFPIAIIGSRKASLYARNHAEKMGKELSNSGIVVISGLAYGIDTSAHQGAIEAISGSVAILAGGHLHRTQREKLLSQKIVSLGGAIISEHPPNTALKKHLFPYRNRIISGISKGVIIIEATEKSGSLITARLAMEQNKDIFALPGSVDNPNTKGVHRLIQEGAFCLTSSSEILEYYGLKSGQGKDPLPKEVANAFAGDSISINELSYKMNISIPELMTKISEWELLDYIEKLENGYYRLKLY